VGSEYPFRMLCVQASRFCIVPENPMCRPSSCLYCLCRPHAFRFCSVVPNYPVKFVSYGCPPSPDSNPSPDLSRAKIFKFREISRKPVQYASIHDTYCTVQEVSVRYMHEIRTKGIVERLSGKKATRMAL
jgi:hypothetical protein